VPQNRPWYISSVKADGEVGFTQPYSNIFTGEVVTFARRIFDEDGEALGVVCLDVKLERIKQLAVNTQSALNGYGFLLSDKMELIAHPDPSLIGVRLRNVKSYIADYEDDLRRNGHVYEITTTDYRNIKCIVFIEKLQNGWYMGIVTTSDKFYQSIRSMAKILTSLGAALAVILILILARINEEKNKADELTKEKTREANDSKRTNRILENILNSIDAQIYVSVPHTGEILFVNDLMKKTNNLKGDCVGQLCYKTFITNKVTDKDGICDFFLCYILHEDPNGIVAWELPHPVQNRIYRNTNRYIEWYDGRTALIQYSIDETDLISAKEQAIEANKAKSNFLAKVSHEVRTPMNAILGITEIQLQNEGLPQYTQDALGYIYNSGYLLLSIINDILDLSKIEAGKLELSPVNYDVPSLINDTVHLNIMRYDSKPIEFILQADENVPTTLFGDELRIKQILNNLLSNAFKYTESGKIILSITSEARQEKADGIMLIFRVSDTGQGMTDEQLDKLFEEYTRFNSEANRTTVGTGLGMNITKNLVHMMNGEISAESKFGKGSAFTIRLPQGTVAGSSVLGRELAESLGLFRLGRAEQMKKMPQITRDYMPYGKILIVDDMETNLYVAKGLLTPYGLSIETSLSGFDAIEKIKKGANYDIIFMDHFMPKMDGIEAVKIIRGMGYTRPIVALTANALTGQSEIFMANGFDGYISKPIDIRQMNVTLNKLIRDKYPVEIVEAARKIKNSRAGDNSANETPLPFINSELAKVFTRDAEKAAAELKAILEKNNNFNDKDFKSYVINVHAMKSALTNIGETELSDVAIKLEQAGRARDIAVMTGETPAFLNSLLTVIEKINPKEFDENGEKAFAENDEDWLLEKFAAIRSACAEYDKKTAKAVLAEIRQKIQTQPVNELLDAIAEHLLHSEFSEAAALTEKKP
jgi:signal transduction histidine kinase/DNA-binding response OmpR family regulator